MFGSVLMMANVVKYSIVNSVRMNGTSDYFSRTLTTSATTSGSIWVKRSKLGATSPIFDNKVYFTSGDALYAFGLTSAALYRDPSAWYHVFWNGTGVYVNGTLVTGSGTYTPASATNPRLGYDGTNYFSGYFSDFAFWDGSSASLQGGASVSGYWAARRPSAGYSFLAFGSSGTLGTDTSGNGNNWTVNGSPVQTVDTPTNNYCTWNPLVTGTGSWARPTLSNGNLTVGGADSGMLATIGMTSGKWYWEITCGSNASPGLYIGIATAGQSMYLITGYTANWMYRSTNGNKFSGGSTSSAYGSPYGANAVIGVAFDADAGTLTFYNNNTSQGTAFTGLTGGGPYFPVIHSDNAASYTHTANFGATSFAYTPPTGFKAICTANLPSVAVTTSGTFTGNANADGQFVWTNGNPATLTINGNAVTFGTHADKTSGGFKLRTSSASYNTIGSNTWTATAGNRFVSTGGTPNTAQGNP